MTVHAELDSNVTAAMYLVRYCRTKIRESTFKRSFIFVQIFEWNLARSLSKMFHHKLVKPVWPDYKFICLVFGHLHQLKFVRWQIKFAKIISKFCKIRCEPVQNGQSFYHCPRWRNFTKSGYTGWSFVRTQNEFKVQLEFCCLPRVRSFCCLLYLEIEPR